MLKSMCVRLSVLVFVCMLSRAALAIADSPKPVNISAGDLVPALEALAKQCGIDVIYPSAQLKGLKTHGVSGTLEPKEAFRKLIEGTPLILKEQGGAVLIALPSPASAHSPSDANAASQDLQKEGKSASSGGFLLAQGATEQAPESDSVAKTKGQENKQKPIALEEVIVTGSRIPIAAGQGAGDLRVYTRQRIEQSGQTSVADFLNTLPEASIAINEAGQQAAATATTVQLHGLPLGSTLVLINGRRVEVSGAQTFHNFFDLNNVPLSAVERIEVLSEGSSAIYGSDAIAGVVNVVLKKHVDGIEANVKYGGAPGTNEADANVGWGASSDRGSISILASYQARSELDRFERRITASDDHTSQGGTDFRSNDCSPGNVYSIDGTNLPGLGASFAAVPAGFKGPPTQQEFVPTAGTLNACSNFGYQTIIPATRRAGIVAQGDLAITERVELFSELMWSHVAQYHYGGPNELFGIPGFQQFMVPAANPFNPFGETVGVSQLYPTAGRSTFPVNTDFLRPLVGARGTLPRSWDWELAGWISEDWSRQVIGNQFNSTSVQDALNSANPQTALDPFVDGPGASPQLLQSFIFNDTEKFLGQTIAASGFVRGPALQLPAGPLQLVLGGEFDKNRLYSHQLADSAGDVESRQTFHRTNYALFAESRIPILGNLGNLSNGETAALTLAGRRDSYSDFGNKTTPQFGAELRPADYLLIRGTYARAFKAPGLFQLGAPDTKFPTVVTDPLRGNQQELVTATSGGNSALRPETGSSRTLGLSYSSQGDRGLQLSVTYWRVDENNSIQSIIPNVVAANEGLFPGAVTRAATCASGPPCPITNIAATFANFGRIDVNGFDYHASYRAITSVGTLVPSINVTQTNRYLVALTPGAPPTDATSKAQDSGDWAPRWKGTAALEWSLGPFSALLDARYVGRYRDYDATNEIGNFWLSDFNFRYALGNVLSAHAEWLKQSYVAIGGINVFNRQPQYSNFYFGIIGYDEAQADIRGRFLYAQVGLRY